MYYDDYDEYVDDKERKRSYPIRSDRTIDDIGFDAVGGVGQLIYHLFRFKGYEFEYEDNGILLARPICKEGFEPEPYTQASPTGTELFVSLYNLAKRINDFSEEKPYTELIMDWCRTVAHPYAVDFIFEGLNDEISDVYKSCGLLEKDATFSINNFMRDLERFYHAATMYFAFEEVCLGLDDISLSAYKDGKHFSGIPFFEKFKVDPDDTPEVDYSSAGGDLIEEMKLDSAAGSKKQATDYFTRVPYDYIDELQKILVDMVPDFRMRLKINPKTQRAVFAADINSVFDICWYTLARKISEDVAPDDKGTEEEKPKGIILTCPYCGDAFVRRSTRTVTCGKPECHKARKRMNQRNSRMQRKIKELQNGDK